MARVVNQTKGTVVAERVGHARSFWRRFRGLMLQSSLDGDAGLLIEPSGSIHTAFMRFPIDAVFLDKQRQVVKVATAKPWRAALSKGHSVLELPAGRAALAGVERAVVVEFLPQPAFDEDGFGHRAGEARRVVAPRGYDFGQHFRCAGGGVDALHLGVEHRGRDFHAVGFLERGFLAQVLPDQVFQRGRGQRLLEGRFLAKPMVVINAFHGRAVGAE